MNDYILSPAQKKARMNKAEKRVTHQNARPFLIHSNGKTRIIKRNDLEDVKMIAWGFVAGIVFCLVSWAYIAV